LRPRNALSRTEPQAAEMTSNAQPRRLVLDDPGCRTARDAGVLVNKVVNEILLQP